MAKGGTVEVVRVPLTSVLPRTLDFPLAFVGPPRFLEQLAIPVTRVRYPNGMMADFAAHFQKSLVYKPCFAPDREFQHFLIQQLMPQPISRDDAVESLRFMCGTTQGRKTSPETIRQIELRRQNKSIPKIAAILAEEKRTKLVKDLTARGEPAAAAERKARAEYGREWQILEQKKIHKNLANQRKTARRRNAPKNYFGDSQNFMLVLRTENKFLKVESSGKQVPQ